MSRLRLPDYLLEAPTTAHFVPSAWPAGNQNLKRCPRRVANVVSMMMREAGINAPVIHPGKRYHHCPEQEGCMNPFHWSRVTQDLDMRAVNRSALDSMIVSFYNQGYSPSNIAMKTQKTRKYVQNRIDILRRRMREWKI